MAAAEAAAPACERCPGLAIAGSWAPRSAKSGCVGNTTLARLEGPTHTPATPHALRPYRIRCAGLEYIALANSASQAVIDALALHGLRTVIAMPLSRSTV